ncbi:MAG: chemotaxis protein CheX [Lachnospiraceae bacterium]|nr:chemotaxis protein CheX [Lachnospiraceae bacterium]
MFANIFGRYLVKKKIITDDEFHAIKMQFNRTRVKLGLIAVSEKLMTEEMADEVNQKQQLMDRKFGDIAVSMGYLTEVQVERLLSLQGNEYMRFCQSAVDKEILTLEQIEGALDYFKKENGFTFSDMEAIKSGDVDRILPLYLPEIPDGPLIDLLSLTFRCINRLASDDISLKRGYTTSSFRTGAVAMQQIVGDYNVINAFSGDDQGILAIAEAFAKQFFDGVNINALDSVGEFINISDGLFATAKSSEGMELNLQPPRLSKDPIDINGSTVIVIPIFINQQPLDWVVSLGTLAEE